MAKARQIPGLEPGTRFGEAAAADRRGARGRGVRARRRRARHADIERVHDMRVATRRLRAAMEVFAACFPAKEHKKLLKEVKRLADALGERRDPDVAIEELEAIAERGWASIAACRPLIKELRAEQERGERERWPPRCSAIAGPSGLAERAGRRSRRRPGA